LRGHKFTYLLTYLSAVICGVQADPIGQRSPVVASAVNLTGLRQVSDRQTDHEHQPTDRPTEYYWQTYGTR